MISGRKQVESNDQAMGHVPLPRVVRVFWIASFVALALALLISIFEFHARLQQARWDPLSDPLLGDLMEYPGTYLLLHSAAFFYKDAPGCLPEPMFSAVAYPPFAAALIAPLYLLGSPIWNFFTLAAAGLVTATLGVRRALLRWGVREVTASFFPLTLLAVSFPVQRLVHQGNIELILWFFAAGGVWAFLRKRNTTAAVFWGLAAAMKLFPILLLILLLPRRRYTAFLAGVGTFVGASVVSLWWLGPSVNVAWHGFLRNVFGYQSLRVSEWTLRELVANHSIFGVVKIVAMIVHLPPSRLTLVYYLFGAAVMGWAFFIRLWKMPVANQLLAVSVFMVMFPPISYYHTLIHLYAPLLVLIFVAFRAEAAGTRLRGLGGAMLLFVPLFVPYTLLTFRRAFLFCGILQSLVLLALFFCALEFPFPDLMLPQHKERTIPAATR